MSTSFPESDAVRATFDDLDTTPAYVYRAAHDATDPLVVRIFPAFPDWSGIGSCQDADEPLLDKNLPAFPDWAGIGSCQDGPEPSVLRNLPAFPGCDGRNVFAYAADVDALDALAAAACA